MCLWQQIQADPDLVALINNSSLISLESPAEHQENSSDPSLLSVYLYRIVEDPYMKNRMSVEGTGGRVRKPPMSIDLVLPDHSAAEGAPRSANRPGKSAADTLRPPHAGRARPHGNPGHFRRRGDAWSSIRCLCRKCRGYGRRSRPPTAFPSLTQSGWRCSIPLKSSSIEGALSKNTMRRKSDLVGA